MINSQAIIHINLAKRWRGGENQTFLLMQSLSSVNCKQYLITSKGSELSRQAKSIEGLKIMNIFDILSPRSKLPKNAICHAHEARATYVAYLLSEVKNYPYLITRRMDLPPKKRFLTKKVYSTASEIVAISEATKKALENFAPGREINYIPSCHSKKHYEKNKTSIIRRKLIGESRFLIGHAGALIDKHKGQAIILEAVKKLQNDNVDVALALAGSGSDEAQLRELAKNIKNVHFLGQVSTVENYIAAFDIFVFPSRNEGLGSVLLDVMRCRVPIVASNAGGITDLIEHGRTGMLCPKNDPDCIAKAIRYLLDNKEDARKIAINAEKYSEKYSPEIMRDKYLRLYGNILAKN